MKMKSFNLITYENAILLKLFTRNEFYFMC